MRILNLGCGSKTSQNPDVLNIDWSVSLIIKKNFFLRILLSKFLSKERQDNFRKLPNNIIVHDLKKGLPYENNSVDAVYHSHLLEHIDRYMMKNFLLEIFRVLKPDGVQRIVVPDLYYLCKSYVENHEKCIQHNQIIKNHDNYVLKHLNLPMGQNLVIKMILNLLLNDNLKISDMIELILDLPLAISLKEGIVSTEILYCDNLSKIFL